VVGLEWYPCCGFHTRYIDDILIIYDTLFRNTTRSKPVIVITFCMLMNRKLSYHYKYNLEQSYSLKCCKRILRQCANNIILMNAVLPIVDVE